MKNTKRIAVLILCTVMCLCFVGCGKTKEEEYLPKLDHMESELNDALAAMFEGTDTDVGKVQSFEITDQNESTHDKSFYCDALNESLMVTGLAKDGKVIQIQTILLIDEDIFDSMDDDETAALVGVALFPASIFDPNIETLDDYNDIIHGLEEVDDPEFNGDSMRYVSGDIEYAMISGYADSMAIISFNIRYLPAFPGGYFDDNTISIAEGSWKQAYNEILDLWAAYYDDEYGMWNYCLYDIDEDGVPEMFVKIGTCEADAEINAYTVDNYGDAYLLGTIWASHSGLCGLATKGEMLRHNASMGVEIITKVYIENNELKETEIFSAEVDEYHEFKYLTTYRLSDPAGLEWTSNPKENNQAVLDDYSMNGQSIVTASVDNPIDLLNEIWSQYAKEDKFAVVGGDFSDENATMEGAGRFGLDDAESLDYALGIPAACVEYLDDAASLMHMMNSNIFTCGAYHVADAANVDKVVEGLEQNIMARQWMCGMPDKLYIYTIDQYVVSFFGHDEPTFVFKTMLESVYPTAELVYAGDL